MILDPLNEERIKRIHRELAREFNKPIPVVEVERWMPGIVYRSSGMIELTKLNGTPFVLNAELIETMEATPDTVISLVTGRKYLVRESVDEVRRKTLEYKRSVWKDRIPE